MSAKEQYKNRVDCCQLEMRVECSQADLFRLISRKNLVYCAALNAAFSPSSAGYQTKTSIINAAGSSNPSQER
jgi:hypothetical protein